MNQKNGELVATVAATVAATEDATVDARVMKLSFFVRGLHIADTFQR